MILLDFSTEEAAKLAGVERAKIANWQRTGFLRASVPASRRGVDRRYSFRDLVAIRVAADLRKAGVSIQLLRKVVAYLRARDGLSATEALARTNLVTDGQRVFEVDGDVTIQLPSGQRTMNVTIVRLDEIVSEVQRKARAFSRAA